MSLVINPYRFVAPSGPAAVEYVGNTTVPSTASETISATVSLGAAASDRVVLVVVHWVYSAPNYSTGDTLSSLKLGGVAASILAQTWSAGGGAASPYNQGCALCALTFPAGNSASAEANFSYNTSVRYVFFDTFRMTGAASDSPTDVASATSAQDVLPPPVSLNLDVNEDGVMVAAATVFGTATSSMTNVPEDYNLNVIAVGKYIRGGCADISADATKSISISNTSGGTKPMAVAMVAAAFS